MKTLLLYLILWASTTVLISQDNALYHTERFSIKSVHLDEERDIQVYLPHNYNIGLIEQLSLVSEKIPELIVVGIASKGHSQYKINCTPSHFKNMKGKSESMMNFIDKELKPHINSKYRGSDYDIIIGHSLGGLLVTDYMLKRPLSFDNFISIDPSIWWGSAQEVQLADSLLTGKEELESNFFISLANTKGMQIREFVGKLDKHLPMSAKWHFLEYDDENHGSVGLPTIKDALLHIFDGYVISREQFYDFNNVDELIDYNKDYINKYNSKLTIPTNAFSNIIYFYYRQDKKEDLSKLEGYLNVSCPSSLPDFYTKLASFDLEIKKYESAQKYINKALSVNPQYFLASREQANLFYALDQKNKAIATITKAINTAKNLHIRQWLINEMEYDLETYLK